MQRIRWWRVYVTCVLVTVCAAVTADERVFEPAADATLFEDNPDFASGAGDFLFFGPIASGSTRRALLRFDVSAIPAGAVIDSVSLRYTVDKAGIGSRIDDPLRVHRVLAAWGEGASNAGTGGAGTPAAQGDATWVYRHYLVPAGGLPHTSWLAAGGDFAATPSAVATVGGVGNYVIASSPGLVADVQHWVDAPSEAYGWILVGPEGNDVSQRARRLYSRSSPATDARPRLTVSFTPPPPLARQVPWPGWSLGLLGLAVAALGLRIRVRRTLS